MWIELSGDEATFGGEPYRKQGWRGPPGGTGYVWAATLTSDRRRTGIKVTINRGMFDIPFATMGR